MNRRSFLGGLVAVPVVAAVASLPTKTESHALSVVERKRRTIYGTIAVSDPLLRDQAAFIRALDIEMGALRSSLIAEVARMT